MTSLYFLSTWDPAAYPANLNEDNGWDNRWDNHIKEIKELNPEYIVCWSAEEVESPNIMRGFFTKMQEWLEKNDRVINLITPNLTNDTPVSLFTIPGTNISIPANRIITEQSLGCILSFMYYHYSKPSTSFSIEQYASENPDIWYTCYNNKAKPERAMLVDILARDNLLDNGLVTFHYPDQYKWKHHDGTKLMDEPTFNFDDPSGAWNNSYILPVKYNTGLIDIACESNFGQGEFFITEKTLKSILIGKPFISLSCKDFNTVYLRDYLGFELYTEMFDYSFDQCEAAEDRAEGVANNINRINGMSLSEKLALYDMLIPKLQFNKNRLTELYLDKNKIVPASLKILMTSEVNIHGYTDSVILDHMSRMKWIYK